MKPRSIFLATAVAVFLMSGCAEEQVAPAATPKALLILVDGIPADVLENSPTPNLDSIGGAHGYTRSWVGGIVGEASETPTISAPGYASLLTGTWGNKHNIWDNNISEPNYEFWDIFRIAKAHDPNLRTAIFSTWTDNRTKLLGEGLEAAGGEKLDYEFDGFELDEEQFPHNEMHDHIREIDAHVTNEAARYVEAHGPDLSWVYLEYTDTVGHGLGDSAEQTAAVRLMDAQIGRISDAVATRVRSHDENWLLIVTTDHGRTADDGKNHGGQSERERTTWIVTNSQNLNTRFANQPPIVDILPSIAAHLELGIPDAVREQLDGQSFID